MRRSFWHSFSAALHGIVEATRSERNLRVHFGFALLVLLLASAWHFSPLEWAILVLTVALVIALELVNTAIEAVVDLVSPQVHPLARKAKDVAAGAVLCGALAAVAVGVSLFGERWLARAPVAAAPVAPLRTALLGGLLAFGMVIAWKATRRSFRLAGGWPSAHAALAFALATAVYYVAGVGFSALAAATLAALVAQSRIEAGIHSWAEVLAGAALGILAMALVFQVR